MYKLITIFAAAIPIILFAKSIFFRKSKVISEASSKFRTQVGYLAWMILFGVGCAIAYSLVKLIWR